MCGWRLSWLWSRSSSRFAFFCLPAALSGLIQLLLHRFDFGIHQILKVLFHVFEAFLEVVNQSILHPGYLRGHCSPDEPTASGIVSLLPFAFCGQLLYSPFAGLIFTLSYTFASCSAAVIALCALRL